MKFFNLRKDKKPLSFKASAVAGELVLEMYDVIGADWMGEGITINSVSDAISAAGEHSSIKVRLNSPGGDLFQGVSIYNLLRAQKKPLTTVVDGLAASAASLIAMAGDKREMGQGAMIMIHNAMAMCGGNSADMRAMAEVLDTVSASAADVYVTATGMDKKKVQKLMDAETWMGTQDCIENSFATGTSSDNDDEPISNAFDLSIFKNVPAALRNEAKTKEVDGEALTAGDFIWVGDPDKVETWALPWHFSTEEKTQSHLRDALARFDQEEKIPESEKPEAHAKLVRIAKEHGIDVSDKKTNSAEPEYVEDPLIGIMRSRLELLRALRSE